MTQFKRKANIIPRLKAFTELNITFRAVESRLFSLDRLAASLPQVHVADFTQKKMRKEISDLADQLVEVFSLVAPKLQ